MTVEPLQGSRSPTRRRIWVWGRLLGGAAILGILVWRLGTGPFLDGFRLVDGWSLAAAAAIGAVTTVCCAVRWTLVSRGLGVELPVRPAVAAYYRSQFLNTVLPGGVLGDVHRGVSHGRAADDVGRGLRAVAWERTAGQVVQAVLATVVLVTLPSPVRSSMPAIVVMVLVVGILVVLLARAVPHDGSSTWARTVRTAGADIRDGLLARRSWPWILLASIVVVAGHTATFMVAARTAGSTESPVRMLPLALLVLLAMGVPTSLGGWGPREGAAAWVFGAAGLGASQGVAVSVVYGVMALVATLPGAVVLLAGWLRRAHCRPAQLKAVPVWHVPTAIRSERAARG